MNLQRVAQMCQKRPFAPFQIHMSDGTVRLVRHPEMVITTFDTLYIGIEGPEPPGPGMASHVEIIGDEHVVKITPPAPAAKESA